MKEDKLIYLLTLNFEPFADGRAKYAASSKATEDVRTILTKSFLVKEKVLTRRFRNKLIGPIEFIIKFCCVCFFIPKGNIVFVQYPMVNISAFTRVIHLLKRFTSIAIIHDLQSYRYENQYHKREQELGIINSFDFVIVHSEKMRNLLQNDGIRTKMIVLQAFDYLLPQKMDIQKKENVVVFAGALHKSGFLQDMNKITETSLSYNLYGVIREELKTPSFVTYKGLFSPNDVSVVEGEWGLLWDGNSIENCEGQFGRYLEIIAPHKFSLYLACGLKIIVWEKSAMASLVEKRNLGIIVKDLYEVSPKISALSEKEKAEMGKNVTRIKEEIRTGHFFLSAMEQID
ncbi:MAG: hypothetical protein J6Y55_04670 [Bacteroidales bacterium]|nr:hypothetical protein [Bacteroidales bacterium]